MVQQEFEHEWISITADCLSRVTAYTIGCATHIPPTHTKDIPACHVCHSCAAHVPPHVTRMPMPPFTVQKLFVYHRIRTPPQTVQTPSVYRYNYSILQCHTPPPIPPYTDVYHPHTTVDHPYTNPKPLLKATRLQGYGPRKPDVPGAAAGGLKTFSIGAQLH